MEAVHRWCSSLSTKTGHFQADKEDSWPQNRPVPEQLRPLRKQGKYPILKRYFLSGEMAESG